MPHIVVQHSGAPDARLTHETVDRVVRLTEEILGKRRDVIAVAVDYVAADRWFVGGAALDALGRSAFHLDITITDETNTKAEKGRYVRAVFAAMAALRPDLHPVSYVHLIDARAAAYGYGGETQEYRFQHPAA